MAVPHRHDNLPGQMPSLEHDIPSLFNDFFRFVGGKIGEQWADLDALGLMQQLGGIPTMG